MQSRVLSLLGEAKSKMNGYVALTSYRYSNLCVKADVVSLLPVVVKINGEESNIETVANVGLVNEFVLGVIPKSPNFLYDIGKGVKEAHPEFKMDVVQNENSDDEEDKYLQFTMPEVDKPRHDVLTDGVDGLHDQCKAKLDAVNEYYGARIGVEMVNADADTVNQVKDQLKKLYDFHNNLLEKQTNTKKQEIEDAYANYQQKQAEKEQNAKEQADAHNPLAGASMKLGGE